MPDRRPSVPEVFRKGVQLLEGQRIPYIVVGGLAAGLQGRPRVTEDVDFMITLPTGKVWSLAEAARKEGFDVDPHEAELHSLASGFVRLWLGPPQDQVALDLMASNSDYLREACWCEQHAVCMGHRVPIASPEDMILQPRPASLETGGSGLFSSKRPRCGRDGTRLLLVGSQRPLDQAERPSSPVSDRTVSGTARPSPTPAAREWGPDCPRKVQVIIVPLRRDPSCALHLLRRRRGARVRKKNLASGDRAGA